MTDDITILGDIIAFLALLLSGYATWRAHKFKQREEEILDIQKKLNALIIDKEEREAANEKSGLRCKFHNHWEQQA